MKKVMLSLISLSFLCSSIVQAQITSFPNIEASEHFVLSEVELDVTPKPFINQPNDFIVCDDRDGNVDGITEFDLTSIDDEVSTDLDTAITYHNSQDDAHNGLSTIVDSKNYSSAGETIYVRAENTLTGDYETTSFNLEVNLIPLASFDPKYNYEVDLNNTNPQEIGLIPTNFTAEQVSIQWYLDDILIPNESRLILSSVRTQGDYKAVITFNATGCQSNLISAKVSELESSEFPQGISPGNDGLNDTFDLSSYDVTRLEIFNRNGILVYSKLNYTNEWVGQTNDGEELPVGTYFYSMEYEGGAKKRGAWVYVNR
jgi:gliding motility-associated-like protein